MSSTTHASRSSRALPSRKGARRDLAPRGEAQRRAVPAHRRPDHHAARGRLWRRGRDAQSGRRAARNGPAIWVYERDPADGRVADGLPRTGAWAEVPRGRVEDQRHCRVAGRDLQGELVCFCYPLWWPSVSVWLTRVSVSRLYMPS